MILGARGKRIENKRKILTMKKYLMMVVAALMATTGVNAQNEELTWSFMPKVGWNLCTWAGDPDAKWMSGYMGGF